MKRNARNNRQKATTARSSEADVSTNNSTTTNCTLTSTNISATPVPNSHGQSTAPSTPSTPLHVPTNSSSSLLAVPSVISSDTIPAISSSESLDVTSVYSHAPQSHSRRVHNNDCALPRAHYRGGFEGGPDDDHSSRMDIDQNETKEVHTTTSSTYAHQFGYQTSNSSSRSTTSSTTSGRPVQPMTASAQQSDDLNTPSLQEELLDGQEVPELPLPPSTPIHNTNNNKPKRKNNNNNRSRHTNNNNKNKNANGETTSNNAAFSQLPVFQTPLPLSSSTSSKKSTPKRQQKRNSTQAHLSDVSDSSLSSTTSSRNFKKPLPKKPKKGAPAQSNSTTTNSTSQSTSRGYHRSSSEDRILAVLKCLGIDRDFVETFGQGTKKEGKNRKSPDGPYQDFLDTRVNELEKKYKENPRGNGPQPKLNLAELQAYYKECAGVTATPKSKSPNTTTSPKATETKKTNNSFPTKDVEFWTVQETDKYLFKRVIARVMRKTGLARLEESKQAEKERREAKEEAWRQQERELKDAKERIKDLKTEITRIPQLESEKQQLQEQVKQLRSTIENNNAVLQLIDGVTNQCTQCFGIVQNARTCKRQPTNTPDVPANITQHQHQLLHEQPLPPPPPNASTFVTVPLQGPNTQQINRIISEQQVQYQLLLQRHAYQQSLQTYINQQQFNNVTSAVLFPTNTNMMQHNTNNMPLSLNYANIYSTNIHNDTQTPSEVPSIPLQSYIFPDIGGPWNTTIHEHILDYCDPQSTNVSEHMETTTSTSVTKATETADASESTVPL